MYALRTDADDVLGPENIVPAQSAGGIGPYRGERALLAAVLIDAIALYRRCRNTGRTRLLKYHEVDAWFATERRDSPFAFVAICDELGLSPRRIREKLEGPRLAFNRVHGSRTAIGGRYEVPA